MSENKIIAAQIQVDTGNSGAQVAALNKETSSLNQTLKNTGATTDGSTKNFSNLKDKMGELPGPLGAASSGVSKLNTMFKALLANPIVLVIAAIVGALTLLYKAFTSTNDGADKMEQIMSGLGAVLDVLRDRVLKIAGAVVKFFKLDFAGAAQDAKAAFSGMGDEIASEFSKAANATKKLQEVEDATRELGVTRAKLNKDLAEAKEIISDENASLEEKRKAIERVREAEGKQTAQELANAKKKLEAIKAKNALSDTSDEDLQKEADAQAELYSLEEKSARDRRTLNRQLKQAETEAASKAREAQAKILQKQKEDHQNYVEFVNKLNQLRQENALLSIKDQYERELKELDFKVQNEKAALLQSFKDKKLTQEQYNQLLQATELKANLERQAAEDKHNEEVKTKEEAFQKELASISTRTRLQGIVDSRDLERAQLEVGYEEKLNDAIKRYKDDQAKLNQIKTALDAEYRQQQDQLDQKYQKEDFEKELSKLAKQAEDDLLTLDQRRAFLDQEQLLIDEAFNKKILSEEVYNQKREALSQARQKIDEIEVQNKFKLLAAIEQGLNAASDFAGKNTIVGKALAVAASTINTYAAIAGQLKAFAGVPIPGYAIAQAIATGLVGLKAVRDIVAVKVPGGGSGGGSAPSLSAPAAPLAPVAATTKLDQQSINSIGNAAQGGVNRPVRAYVVNADISNEADRNARLERAAQLGG